MTSEDTRNKFNKKERKVKKRKKEFWNEQIYSDYHPIGISKNITSDVFQVSMTKLFYDSYYWPIHRRIAFILHFYTYLSLSFFFSIQNWLQSLKKITHYKYLERDFEIKILNSMTS